MKTLLCQFGKHTPKSKDDALLVFTLRRLIF